MSSTNDSINFKTRRMALYFLAISTITLLVQGCTTIRKGICAGCLDSLSIREATKYKNISLDEFLDDRFTDSISKIDSAHIVNKRRSDGHIILNTLDSQIERPYNDFAAYCQVREGILIVNHEQKTKMLKLSATHKDINNMVKDTYRLAKSSAPTQYTVDTGFGIQNTYSVNSEQYAISVARSHYADEISRKIKIDNSFSARKYYKAIHLGKLGSYQCIKDNKVLWQVTLLPIGSENVGDRLWFNIDIFANEKK